MPWPRWRSWRRERLPDGFGYEWTELAYQEKLAGNTALLVFGAAVVFVFLVLAAQYESWSLPLRGHPDRADVPAGGGHRACCCGA